MLNPHGSQWVQQPWGSGTFSRQTIIFHLSFPLLAPERRGSCSGLTQMFLKPCYVSSRYLWIPWPEPCPQRPWGLLAQDHVARWIVASLFKPGKDGRTHLRWKATLLMVFFFCLGSLLSERLKSLLLLKVPPWMRPWPSLISMTF